jgi:hypothetical protein
MTLKRITLCFGIIFVCLLSTTISLAVSSGLSETENQEYKQDMARINAVKKTFKPGQVNNLEEYEKFANEIQSKWKQKNKEHSARLMLEICGPLSSGWFKDDRRYGLAKKYALSVLDKPEEISVESELELTGHVVTLMYIPSAPKGEDFAQRRRKDVEVRLHARKRLIDSIDPKWDPNEELLSPNAVGAFMGLPSGIAPESVGDPRLRAEYEEALQKNSEIIQRHSQQRRLHRWLKWYPKMIEEDIILLYSEPPFNLEELRQYLGKYAVDEKTRARILDAVTKNMQQQTQKNSTTQ